MKLSLTVLIIFIDRGSKGTRGYIIVTTIASQTSRFREVSFESKGSLSLGTGGIYGASLPRKKSFPWNKSGGRQLVEMHGIRSVKGKAEAAEQFRLECVYADASPSLSLSATLPSPLPPWYSHSYYFSSVLVTVGTTERTKEGSRKGKR